jgi:hypothetical protein
LCWDFLFAVFLRCQQLYACDPWVQEFVVREIREGPIDVARGRPTDRGAQDRLRRVSGGGESHGAFRGEVIVPGILLLIATSGGTKKVAIAA